MGKTIPTRTAKQPIEVASAVSTPPTNEETNVVPHVDTHKARRAIPRDAAIVLALNTTLNEAAHLHDPIDQHEADGIFASAVKGLADQMLLPILTSGQHVLEGGDLSFQYDTQPIAPSSDRHASKLVRKRAKRRKQSYAAAVKISIYGSYAASRASSRTESRFGGSRFGGSRASASVRGTGLASKMPKMSLIYGLNSGGESLMNSSWIGSQQGSTDTASNNVSWLQGGGPNVKNSSPPASISGTARVAVDFVELQRRAGIERDLNTRDSFRRSHDEFNRKNDIRLKLRSLADPTVSLEKEEAMLAALGAKGQRFRLQHGRQGTRGKTPGIPPTNLSPLDGKRRGLTPSAPATDETTTFRTEDYEGLASDVVLFSKGGELVIGENCFVVEQKLRQELLLDLQTQGVVQPRIQLVTTPKPDEESTSGENSPSNPQQSRASPPPLRPPGALPPPKQELPSHGSAFGDQIGSFESSPSLALDLEAAPLAKGVILKLPDTAATRALASKTRNGAPKKVSKKAPISESVPNANLEKQLNAMIKAPKASKPALTMSHSDSVLQTNKALSTAASPLTSGSSTKSSQANNAAGAGSPVLPKHIHNGEKHLQSLRIRTPACPNRLSRKTPSRTSLYIDGDEYGWNSDAPENLFSLHEHSSTSSLPNVKYVREFPKPPQGRVQLFGTTMHSWKLPSTSTPPFSFASTTASIEQKR